MSELDELYQEVILDHNKSPRNFREIVDANRQSEGYNPLCGDHVTVYVNLADGVIRDISFKGSGALPRASLSSWSKSSSSLTSRWTVRSDESISSIITKGASGFIDSKNDKPTVRAGNEYLAFGG